MQNIIKWFMAVTAIAIIGGCSSADSTPQPGSEGTQGNLIKQTAVWLNADGTAAKTEVSFITPEQLQGMKTEMAELMAAEARGESFTVTIQSPCMTSSNWFFTNNSCNTSGSFLCLIGSTSGGTPYTIPAGY